MNKVLLIGERYSHNLGDGVICEIVEKQICNTFKKVEVVVCDLSGRKGYIQNSKFVFKPIHKGIYRIGKSFLRKCNFDYDLYMVQKRCKQNKIYFESICNWDYKLAVFAGGQIFQDSIIEAVTMILLALAKKQIPIIFNACGVGRIQPKLLNRFQDAVRSSNIIAVSTRDNHTLLDHYFDNINNITIDKSFDPAIWVKDMYSVDKAREVIGIGAKFDPNFSVEKQYNYWSTVARLLMERGKTCEFFCNGDAQDYNFIKYIVDRLSKQYKPIQSKLIANRPRIPSELIMIISQYKGIISTRLHSHIIAFSLGIPSVAINWNQKVKEFYTITGREDQCFEIFEIHKPICKLLSILDSTYSDIHIRKYKNINYEWIEKQLQRYLT